MATYRIYSNNTSKRVSKTATYKDAENFSKEIQMLSLYVTGFIALSWLVSELACVFGTLSLLVW